VGVVALPGTSEMWAGKMKNWSRESTGGGRKTNGRKGEFA